jgi:hypothetical protein
MIFRNQDRGKAGRRSQGLLIVASAIICILGGAVQSLCQDSGAEARVRERVGAFWTAMQKADFGAAAEFIHPDSRGTFRDRMPKGRSGAWRIEKLEFDKEFTSCNTIVLVERQLPFAAGTPLEWPMRNLWILHQGEWYLKIPWEKDENPLLKMFKEQEQLEAKRSLEKAGSAPPPAPKPAPEPEPDAAGRFRADNNNPRLLHFGEKGIFKYRYKNDTKGPIRIVSAVADCHCTGVRREGYPEVAPGASGVLEVTLDTFGLPLGPVRKDIRVQFSDLKSPVTLHLQLENRPNFVPSPASVDFGELRAGTVAERMLRLKNESGQTVNAIAALNADSRLKVTIEKKTAAPNEEIVLALSYDPSKSGDIMDAISLRVDLASEPLVNIPVRGKVVP